MKELIDYFNEKYTKKKEYICKDLKPIKLLNDDEYHNFLKDAGLINPQEIHYYPLFKAPKIKNNRPMFIGYILKTDGEIYEGNMRQFRGNGYWDSFISIGINGDEIALETPDISINENNCSLTLYVYFPELPKIEYPKNRMDMYRAISFIKAANYSINDSVITDMIDWGTELLPYPSNIDEMYMYLSCTDRYGFKNVYLKGNHININELPYISSGAKQALKNKYKIDNIWYYDVKKYNSDVIFIDNDIFFEGLSHRINIDNRYHISCNNKGGVIYDIYNNNTNVVLFLINEEKNNLENIFVKVRLLLPSITNLNAYILNRKDNYHTVLNAIKKGKDIYYNDRIYPYWEINKEEKNIFLKNSFEDYRLRILENGLEKPPQ